MKANLEGRHSVEKMLKKSQKVSFSKEKKKQFDRFFRNLGYLRRKKPKIERLLAENNFVSLFDKPTLAFSSLYHFYED